MKSKTNQIALLSYASIFAAAFALSACTTSKGDSPEGQEELSAQGEEAAEPGTEEAAATTAEPGEAAIQDAAPQPPMETATAAPAAAPQSDTAAAAKADGQGRVVRYVSMKQAVIHASPSDQAAKVGNLPRGERIMVVEENGWGRITDGMFVKLDALSTKAVPRNRKPATWNKPAH